VPFSGSEVSEKGFPRGWDADAEDQASQRQFRIAQLLEAMVFRPFSWDRFNSLNLKYAFHGGYIDEGTKWLLVGGGSVTLVEGKTNFIERSDAGQVTVNQAGFTYLGSIPMAQIEARNGSFVATTYIDRRPEIGGAPSGASGAITFPMIIGQILDSQVPLSAVQQCQFQLCHLAANVLPGTFGINATCAPTIGDYEFPRDLDVVQDLFVGADALILEDLQVIENLNVGGIMTAEGLAVFQALATFQAAAVFEAIATFEAAVLMESTLNVEGITTLENQTRRGIRTLTAADTPYTLVATDWHINVDISLGSVEVLIPDAAAHFAGGFTDQLHFKIIGSGFGDPFVTLTPPVPGQEIDTFEAAIMRRSKLSFTLVSDGSDWWIQ
jgi:hypothetical protein